MENINLKCRGCLKEEEDMNSIFFSYNGITTFARLLEEVLGYTGIKEEEYSNKLCRSCKRILVDFSNFKTSFNQATEYFKNNVSQNISNQEQAPQEFIPVLKSEGKSSNSNNQYPDIDNSDSNDLDFNNYKRKSPIKECMFCQICGESFKTKLQLRKHNNTQHKIHSKQKKKLNQLLLRESLDKSSSPDVDVNFGDPSQKLDLQKFCKVCKQCFLSEEYELHFETHKIHVCQTCGHRFIRKTDLNDHEEIHSNTCKYVCQHCGKAFKVRTALNKHRRIHTNPREEICDVCGQQFNTRDTLKTHYKLKHLKSKDFQCNLCGLAFTLKSTLEKHIERHNPNRKRIFSCNLCDVSYINKYNLNRHHIIKHTTFETRPSCDFCGKRYTKKSDLAKHLKKHHGRKATAAKSGQSKICD